MDAETPSLQDFLTYRLHKLNKITDDSNFVAAAVHPAASRAPRPDTRRQCEAGFLASGSLLGPPSQNPPKI